MVSRSIGFVLLMAFLFIHTLQPADAQFAGYGFINKWAGRKAVGSQKDIPSDMYLDEMTGNVERRRFVRGNHQ